MTEMKKSDHAFFYHTGDEKQVVGIVEVIREAYLPRSDRREGRLQVARREGGEAVSETGDARGGQG